VLDLQRNAGNRATSELLAPGAKGQQLEPSVRAEMEAGLGSPLDGVRIHADSSSARQAEDSGFAAYTLGNDVVFGPGYYEPHSADGKALLAHELVHTIQQRRSGSSDPGFAEAEARTAGAEVAAGGRAALTAGVPAQVQGQNVWAESPIKREPEALEAEFKADLETMRSDLGGFIGYFHYSQDLEEEVISLLSKWANTFEIRKRGGSGNYLDRIFADLAATPVSKSFEPDSNLFNEMLDRFDRSSEVRRLRDLSHLFRGQETPKVKAKAKQWLEEEAEASTSEGGEGWRRNIAREEFAQGDDPQYRYLTQWYRDTPIDKMTRDQRFIAMGVAREGERFLRRRIHFSTQHERDEWKRKLGDLVVDTMLQVALMVITEGAAELFLPDLLEGVAGGSRAAEEAISVGETAPASAVESTVQVAEEETAAFGSATATPVEATVSTGPPAKLQPEIPQVHQAKAAQRTLEGQPIPAEQPLQSSGPSTGLATPISKKASLEETEGWGAGRKVERGKLKELEPTTREPVRSASGKYAPAKEGDLIKFPKKTLSADWKGRIPETGGDLSVQAGHMVPKSTGAPDSLAIELTSRNLAAETKLVNKEAIEIEGALIERETALELAESGQFPKVTIDMVKNAPARPGWKPPIGMAEGDARAAFMKEMRGVLESPTHPLHPLVESYEDIAGHLPDRPLIPTP
jgi:hypothetical protein